MTPASVRDEIDELVCQRRVVLAIVALRDKSGIKPKPSIPLGKELVAYRYGVLIEQGRVTVPPETTVEEMLAEATTLGEPPVVVEAYRDGDSWGWMICLSVIVRGPSRHHDAFDEVCLAVFRGDDQGEEAASKGQAVAERLGVPFFFADPENGELESPRWWDTPDAGHLAIT
ncbi:hypothetical protein SAMN05192558_11257 [Actinokineospora alba]|uniref:Uncharacterized protein n=1 Tax=Actinokineospora alba TaxID=504798 RepID=A0A1H0UT62_9PSEU|nr:hypothetical protein [Actinokineospora alba]TDP69071.1 hypothetical protein C8E96_4642 [Actinokineospora alba]SDI78862.1 hypothetical protein SAMN05421871_107347 [Actinokineospora alba]SDP69499.1 hypothetical protein SAMN05192558_11257 [Actinokineospora alba]